MLLVFDLQEYFVLSKKPASLYEKTGCLILSVVLVQLQ